eukprot:4202274-Pyramimonas_sp.AAC.1
MLVHLFERVSRRPCRLSRKGDVGFRPAGSGSRSTCACPAPLARGSRGLQMSPTGKFLSVEKYHARTLGINEFSEEAVPASESQQERKDRLIHIRRYPC